ncbi:hypothetical protein [Streptomyces sp. NPDC050548]|uniref:hypothetical protein n=1 Tax=Streptomyces sp. NPDC050548 TaxID=3365629 RepID=UPI0037A3B003
MNSLSHRSAQRRLATFTVAMILPLVMTGCSEDVNSKDANDASNARSTGSPEPTTLAVDKARAKADHLSSQILDMIGIKEGKVAGGGAGVALCDKDPDHLYRMDHPWSIYDVTPDKLKAGFQRLREALPKNGWKIVDYGPDTSANKNLELTADSRTEPFSVNASLHITGPSGEKEPLLAVTVVSGCYRAPEGTDLSKEY